MNLMMISLNFFVMRGCSNFAKVTEVNAEPHIGDFVKDKRL